MVTAISKLILNSLSWFNHKDFCPSSENELRFAKKRAMLLFLTHKLNKITLFPGSKGELRLIEVKNLK